MKKSLYLSSLIILSCTLTACSPDNISSDLAEITTIIERKTTEYSVKFKEYYESLREKFNLEKDNVEELWNDRNLNEDIDEMKEDIEDVKEEITDKNDESLNFKVDQEFNIGTEQDGQGFDIGTDYEFKVERNSNGQGFTINTKE